MLKNLPRKYNPPGNGDRDMERPIYANKVEEMILKALGGSGKMTKHGIPSYSWRDDSSSSDTRGAGSSRGSDGSQGGGNTGGGGGGGGGGFGGARGGLSPGFTGQRNLGLTTGNVTGTSAYGPAGGNAVGMGAPGFENPAATARTLARMQPQVQAPVRQAAPLAVAPVPIPRVKPQVPAPVLGPNVGMINTLPQIGGTVPSQIQQGINFTTQGPTSMPGSPVGPQIGGVTTVGGVGGGRGSWATPGAQPGQTSSPGGQVGGGSLGGGGGGWGAGGETTINKTPSTSPGNTVYKNNGPVPAGFSGPRTRDMMPNYGSGPATDTGWSPPGYQNPSRAFPNNAISGVTGGGGVVPYNSDINTSAPPRNPSMAGKDPSRLPGYEGPTPAPSYNPMLQGEYTPQALNDIRRNNGWIPNPVDTPRPENGVQPVNYHTNWDWTGLGQMDKTGQTVTPRTRPSAVPAGFGLRNLPR